MPTRRHAWPRTVSAARAVQERLRGSVITTDKLGRVRFVAGIDVGFEKAGAITRAAVVVLTFPGLEPHEQAIARRPTRFPYVPGYLSFREAPATLAALAKLRTRPDLLLCDGQGLAHPRRFGLACHLGVLTGLPSIGVAKSLLLGKHGELGEERGAWAALKDVATPRSPHPHSDRNRNSRLLPLSLWERAKGEGDRPSPPSPLLGPSPSFPLPGPSPSFPLPEGEGGEPKRALRRASLSLREGGEPGALARDLVHSEIIGAALRTRAGVRPVYVSIGHRVSLATAIDYVLRCTPRYRLPETTRLAHRLASG